MQYMAELIYKINCIDNNIHVFIFGINGLFDKKNRTIKNSIWSPFYDKLLALYGAYGIFPTLAKHFSHQHIFDDFILDDNNEIQIKPRLEIDDINEKNAASFLEKLSKLSYSDNLRCWGRGKPEEE